jgi:hypothetical protein
MPDPIPTNRSVNRERARSHPAPFSAPRRHPRQPRPALPRPPPRRPAAPRLGGGVTVLLLAVALPAVLALGVLVSPAFLLLVLLAAMIFPGAAETVTYDSNGLAD